MLHQLTLILERSEANTICKRCFNCRLIVLRTLPAPSRLPEPEVNFIKENIYVYRKHNNNVTPPKILCAPSFSPFYFAHEKSMAQQPSRTENPRDFDHIQEDPSHRLSEEGNSNASDLVKSTFADPEALQLLRSAFINPLNSGASKAPHIEPEVQIIDVGRPRPTRRHGQMIKQCPMKL